MISFKNIVLDASSRLYAPILKTIYIPKSIKQSYDTDVLLYNNSQSLMIYDKLAQLEAKGGSTSGVPKNALRFEWRLKKARKVQDSLGIKTVGDLFANYGSLPFQYNHFLQKKVFPFNHCAPPRRRGRTGRVNLVQERLHRIEELLRDRGLEDITFAKLNNIYQRKGIEDVRQLLKSYSNGHAFDAFVSAEIKKLRIAACDRVLVGAVGRRFAELSEKLLGA